MGKTYVFFNPNLAIETLPLGASLTIRKVWTEAARAIVACSEEVIVCEADEAALSLVFVADAAVVVLDQYAAPTFEAGDQILVRSPVWGGWRLIAIGEQTEAVLSSTEEVLEVSLNGLFAGAKGRMRTRLLEALSGMGVRTIRDLLGKTEADILRIPNTGRKSIDLLNELLEEKIGAGVRLGKVRIV